MESPVNEEQKVQLIKAYSDYADPLFRHSYLRMFDRELAQDIVQEAFIRAWREIRKGKTILNIRAFLYQTTRNLIIDWSRRKKRRSVVRDEGEVLKEKVAFHNHLNYKNGMEIGIDVKVEAQHIVATLDQLDERYQEVIRLRHIEGFSVKEIAELLEESEGKISVRLHRGLKELRKLLAAYQYSFEEKAAHVPQKIVIAQR